MVQYKNKWVYHKECRFLLMRKVQWHSVFLCKKKKKKKFLLFFFYLLFCSRQLIRKRYIHWLSSSHWQKALKGRLGSSSDCRYGLFFSYLNAKETVFPTQDNTVSARNLKTIKRVFKCPDVGSDKLLAAAK